MPADRTPGMDHDYYEYSPIYARPALTWPRGAALALNVVLDLEYLELEPPAGAVQSNWLAGGLGPRPDPNLALLSSREYGHRVGIFRVLDLLDKHQVPASVAIDAMTAEAYPWLVHHLVERGVDFVAHGISLSRVISSRMTPAEERGYIEQTLTRLERAIGTRPTGWMGAEQGESERTPHLLAQLGLEYVCDWSNDEQPYPMPMTEGTLWSLPTMLEYDDAFALFRRRLTLDSYRSMFCSGVDQLLLDGRVSGRYLQLNLRPWLIGQPFRVGHLDEMLEHALASGQVWATTPGEVAGWCAAAQTTGVAT
jgi:allantoinase